MVFFSTLGIIIIIIIIIIINIIYYYKTFIRYTKQMQRNEDSKVWVENVQLSWSQNDVNMNARDVLFLGEMQRIAFRLMLSSCVCVCVCVCVYAAFVDLRKTVWDRDAVFVLNCSE